MSRTLAAFFLLAFVALGAALFGVLSSDRNSVSAALERQSLGGGPAAAAQGDPQTAAGRTAASQETVEAPREGHYDQAPGARHGYVFEAAFATSFGEPGAAQRAETSLDLDGRLGLACLARRATESGVELALELALAEVEVAASMPGDSPGPEALAGIAEDLQVPALVRLSADGSILGYRFDPKTSAETRNTLRSLVGYLVVELPADAEARDGWEVSVPGPSGAALVRFAWDGAPAGRRLTRVTEALELEDAGDAALGGPPEASVERSAGSISVPRSERMPRLALVDESFGLTLPGGAFTAAQSTRVRVELRSSSPGDGLAAPGFDWDAPWSAASGAAEEATTAGDVDGIDASLAELSLDELLLLIDQLVASGEIGSLELYEAQLALAERLADDPALLADLSAALAAGRFGLESHMVLVAAVGMAQTAEAQAFLAAEMARDGASARERVHATWSAFQVEAPGATLVDGVQAAFQDPTAPTELRESSMLALGVFASRAGSGDDRGSLDLLLADRERAENEGDLVAWLEALGNSGAPRIVDDVREYLNHAEARIRGAAASALRRVNTAEAAELLAGVATTDVASNVRAVAAGYLSERELPLADETSDRVLSEDAASNVRSRVVDGLARREPRSARVLALLERTAANDSDADVREKAEQALQE